MNMLSWNIGGLGRPKKRRFINKLVRKYEIEVLFIQESKIANNIDRIAIDIWSMQSYG